jgi:hypothetical protein
MKFKIIILRLVIVLAMTFFIWSSAWADCPNAVGNWEGPLKCACDCSCPLPISINAYVTITTQNGCYFKGYVWFGGEGRSLTGRINSATHAIDVAVNFVGLRGTLIKTISGYTKIYVVAPAVDYQNIQCTCNGTIKKQ